MTERDAEQILLVAKEEGYYPDPLPQYEDALMAEATLLITEAREAEQRGARGEAIKRILWLADNLPSEEPGESRRAPGEAQRDSEQPKSREVSADASSVPTNGRAPGSSSLGVDALSAPLSVDSAYESKVRANARIKQEKLPIPPEIEGEAPIIPRDLTKSTNTDVRRLSSEFNACFARASYLVALEEADELAAKQLAEYYYARAVRESNTDNGKTVKIMEAEAIEDETYRLWKSRQLDHLTQVKILKSLRDTYQGNVDRLSREFTMRTVQWEIEGGVKSG